MYPSAKFQLIVVLTIISFRAYPCRVPGLSLALYTVEHNHQGMQLAHFSRLLQNGSSDYSVLKQTMQQNVILIRSKGMQHPNGVSLSQLQWFGSLQNLAQFPATSVCWFLQPCHYHVSCSFSCSWPLILTPHSNLFDSVLTTKIPFIDEKRVFKILLTKPSIDFAFHITSVSH